ncbi:MAG TPA: DUF2243 domain-containing protein [Micromonosporaceae bacterium]|nr:DUF2243 domain-containing protein [Micromonosporaceae bacterium]
MRWQPDRRDVLWPAALLGAGLAAAVDEIVFHQILAWHHFYDRATTSVGLFSDGVLHAVELVAVVAGGYLLADRHRRGALRARPAWSGILLGAGAFQLFDGIVDHKLLRVHQIRYGVDLLPYDIAWAVVSLALIAAGLLLRRGSVRGSRAPAPR